MAIGIGIGIPFTRNVSVISYTYVYDGLDYYRKGIRLGYYVIDYSSDGGVTYELDLVKIVPTEADIVMLIDAGVVGYRQQVRNGALMIDQLIEGGSGDWDTEGTDWENIEVYQTPDNYWLYQYVSQLKGVIISDTQIDLAWVNNGASDYTGHKVYLSTDSGANYTLKDTIVGIGTTYSLTGLTPNTGYFVKVVPYGISTSPYYSIIDITTPETLLYDTFTDTNDVRLSAHTMDIGAGWTEVNGTWVIASNKVNETDQAATWYLAVAESGVTDIDKSLKIVMPNSGNYGIGVCFRYQDSTHYWLAVLSRNALGTPTCGVVSVGGGGGTIITGAITQENGVEHTLRVTTSGNIITLYWNNRCIGSAVDTYLNDKTKHGLSTYRTSTYVYSPTDDYTVKRFTLWKNDEIGNGWLVRPSALYNSSLNKTWIGANQDQGNGSSQYVLTVNNDTGLISTCRVGSAITEDDHDYPSILLLTNNKLFICYSEYVSTAHRIRYRISTNVLDATTWDAEVTLDPDGGDVYRFPSAFQVVNGDIYIFYENLTNSTYCYVKSTDGGATFGASVVFSTKLYCLITQNETDRDILHFVSSYRPNLNPNPNSVTHLYFDAGAGTWHKSDGTDVTANLPLDVANSTTIKSYAHPEQSWIEDIILDSNGYPRVLFTYYPSQTLTPELKKLYYSEWNGTAWSTPYEIHEEMNRNIAGIVGLESYSSVSCFDLNDPDIIFASKDVDGVCEIFKLTRVASDNFTSVQKTTGNTVDQWRPFTVKSTKNNVFWLNKEFYFSFDTFKQQLRFDTF